MTKPQPKRTDFGYLTGWFLVEFKDHRKAKAAARSHLVNLTKKQG